MIPQWERNGKVAVWKTYERKKSKKKKRKKMKSLERVGRIYGFDEGNGRVKMIF